MMFIRSVLFPLVFSVFIPYILGNCCPVLPSGCTCLFSDTLIDCAGQGLTSIPRLPGKPTCGRIVYLSLKNNNIHCPIVENVYNFPDLKHIDLTVNPLLCSCLDSFINFTIKSPNHCSESTSSILITSTRPSPVVSLTPGNKTKSMNYGTPTMSLYISKTDNTISRFDLTLSSVRSSFTTSNYLPSSHDLCWCAFNPWFKVSFLKTHNSMDSWDFDSSPCCVFSFGFRNCDLQACVEIPKNI